MPYLIDGHNLIHFMPDISLDDPNDEAKLVMRLNQYMMRHRKKCTVIFDQGLPGGVDVLRTNSYVKAIFAPTNTNADEMIKDRVRSSRDPGYWQVVTSDQEVAEAARGRGATVISSGEFARLLTEFRESQGPTGEEKNPIVSPDHVEEMLRLFNGRRPRQGPK